MILSQNIIYDKGLLIKIHQVFFHVLWCCKYFVCL